MYSPRQKVLWFAFNTRIFIILLQAISNTIIPDHNANVFISPEDTTIRRTKIDILVEYIFGGLKRWDGQYYVHIAQYGYTYENCLAFFPLFPLIIRHLANLLNSVTGSFINYHSNLIISATLINIVFFIKSADLLHRLSLKILRSESRAYKSVILYCANPANIFFVAPYSESLFAFMSFYTMWKCTEPETLRFANIDMITAIPAGLSMITRSNGSTNLGFLFYTSFKNIIEKTIPEVMYKFKTLKNKILLPALLLPLLTSALALFMTTILTILPFVLVQTYNYFKFCIVNENNLPDFLLNTEFVLPGSAESPWCNDTLPISYSYIQSHYWNVGLLKYYQVRQIPNFMLAMPILLIILYNCLYYVKNNINLFLRLGLKENITNFGYSSKMMSRLKQPSKGFGTNDPVYFVYVVHVMFLTIFSILFVHIQVTTRILASASPILYWICASKMNVGPTLTSDQNTMNEHFKRIGIEKRIPSHHLSIANLEGVDNMYSKWKTFIITQRMSDFQSRLIQCYFLGYTVAGTVLFSNFLPWT